MLAQQAYLRSGAWERDESREFCICARAEAESRSDTARPSYTTLRREIKSARQANKHVPGMPGAKHKQGELREAKGSEGN